MFGNTIASIKGVFYFSAILAVILFVMFVWVDRIHTETWPRILDSMLYSVCIAAIPLVVVLPTCAFALRVDAESISHVLLGRFTLSSKRLGDLRSVEVAKGWGAALKFENGSRIRFLGAHLQELRSLCHYLSEIRPNQISFSTGLVAAGLFSLEDKVKRDA